MANSPLIPTPRVDKNGRTTIRHMKVDADGSVMPVVPVPTLAIRSMEGFDRLKATKSITHIFEEYGDAETGPRWKRALEAFSDEDIARLKDIGDEMENLLGERATRIGRNCAQVVKAIHDGDTEAIGVYHRYRDCVRSNYAFEHLAATRAVLEERGLYEPYSGYEPASFDAHMRMTLSYSPLEEESLEGDDDNGFMEMKAKQNYSRVTHLVDYVEQHPERVDDIMLFRKEREGLGFNDMVAFFDAMEESSAPAVSKGWL